MGTDSRRKDESAGSKLSPPLCPMLAAVLKLLSKKGLLASENNQKILYHVLFSEALSQLCREVVKLFFHKKDHVMKNAD
jgi:hypothetical protein